MARFDVYAHPDRRLREKTPFLLDVQNSFLSSLATRIVVPLRAQQFLPLPVRDLNPCFVIEHTEVVMDTAALAAFPGGELKTPVASLQPQAAAVCSALDTLFGPY